MRKLSTLFMMLLGLSLAMPSMPAAGEPAEIGVAWFGKSPMAIRISKGFTHAIRDLAPNIRLEYRKELASPDEFARVVAEWEKTKKAMVILRSAGAKWLGKNPPAIPTFIGGCNHPVQLGAMKNMQAPEGNITGVTYYLPAETQFEIFKAILPDIKSLLLLLEEGHPSTPIDRKKTKAVCDKMGIRYDERNCSSAKNAVAAVRQLKGKVSAILFGNNKLSEEHAPEIVGAAGNMPILSYLARPVKDGALGGFIADDIKLSRMLAESVADVLVKGKAIRDVPVKTDPDPIFVVNVRTAQRIGIEIPFHILKKAKIVE